MIQVIQAVASASAVILGITYIIGGLVVNLNLARRGITEYQILKVKYLVVGIIYLLYAAGIIVLAMVPAFFLVQYINHRMFPQVLNILSIGASVFLLYLWSKPPKNSDSFLVRWWFWVAAGTVTMIFPQMVLIRQLMSLALDAYSLLLTAQAVFAGTLAFIAQIYHYSCYYYGRHSAATALDPIGVGVLIPVRLAGDKDKMAILTELGISMIKPGITEWILLIDETDKHYIVSVEREEGENTFKVSKDLVDAILYMAK
ncbi:MAG: hypothetical protein JXB38_18095 [Anaerolineales bacterium]|nr:hypothetical protein [Anaerolineales bacterium]